MSDVSVAAIRMYVLREKQSQPYPNRYLHSVGNIPVPSYLRNTVFINREDFIRQVDKDKEKFILGVLAEMRSVAGKLTPLEEHYKLTLENYLTVNFS
jgi:hypothetical protein